MEKSVTFAHLKTVKVLRDSHQSTIFAVQKKEFTYALPDSDNALSDGPDMLRLEDAGKVILSLI